MSVSLRLVKFSMNVELRFAFGSVSQNHKPFSRIELDDFIEVVVNELYSCYTGNLAADQ